MGYELKGLEDKVVLITGAGCGQGASHALNLAEAGCDIAAFDVGRPIEGLYTTATAEDLERTVAEVEATGRRGLALTADIRDAALFLASNSARIVTGQTLFVDAGHSL